MDLTGIRAEQRTLFKHKSRRWVFNTSGALSWNFVGETSGAFVTLRKRQNGRGEQTEANVKLKLWKLPGFL